MCAIDLQEISSPLTQAAELGEIPKNETPSIVTFEQLLRQPFRKICLHSNM